MKVIHDWRYAFVLLGQTINELCYLSTQWQRYIRHCCNMGYQTLLIVAILSLSMGGILALQTGFSLSSFPGAQSHLGSIVGLAMCRELGPLMTAFLLTGRVGSAITAELGSMSVYQEIDALHTMNLSPVRLLVMPRVMAGLTMMPLLTMFSNALGWIGGWYVVHITPFIALSDEIYWRNLKNFVKWDSISNGLFKAEVFALIITLMSCSIGLRTHGGPREIGSSVTSTLVQTMVAILVGDYVITQLLM